MNDDTTKQHTQNQYQAKANKPVEVLRDGALKSAIFKNEREGRTHFAIETGRIYTDKSGNIKETKSFNEREALRMSRLIEKSYDRVNEFKAQMKEQARSENRER